MMMKTTTIMEHLDTSNFPALNKIVIFQVKECLMELQHIAISGNAQFTILANTCLASDQNLKQLKRVN